MEIGQYIDESLELLRKMVRIPSVSFEEDGVAQLIDDTLRRWGLETRRYGRNIVAVNSCYDKSLPSLVLDAHIDTVQPVQTYTRDPYDPGTDADTIYGLGSNDDGGSVVAMIAAFRYLYSRKMPLNLVLALCCEEEKSGPGGAAFLYGPEGPEEIRTARMVLVGEPTGMKAATSERGLLVLDGVAKGVSGHAAREEGVNALYIALDDISVLRSHNFAKISPLMGKVRLNVTQINAGNAHNVIPDECRFVVDIRPTEQYSNGELLGELQALCKSELKARNLRNCSSATPVDSSLMKTVSVMGLETYSSPTTSDWMRICADGVQREGIKLGPGESSRSHRCDEYVGCGEIGDAVVKYVEFIETLYGNFME